MSCIKIFHTLRAVTIDYQLVVNRFEYTLMYNAASYRIFNSIFRVIDLSSKVAD